MLFTDKYVIVCLKAVDLQGQHCLDRGFAEYYAIITQKIQYCTLHFELTAVIVLFCSSIS